MLKSYCFTVEKFKMVAMAVSLWACSGIIKE